MRQRDIFWFWLPLFASWLLMTAEGPIISAVINRLPNEVIMLAAQGVVMGLSVMIESPIINILATSTALSKDWASFRLIRRFTLHMALVLTIITAVVSFTPLFTVVVEQWLGVEPDVAYWVRPGMQIMLLWSAAIAWRRFQQGVMIRFKQTRNVAWGTMVRLSFSVGAVVGLAWFTDWPGIIIGAMALMAGVIAEAGYATWAVRPQLQHELAPTNPPAKGEPLTYRNLFWFHLPLALTSVLVLMLQPMVTSSLSRLDNATLNLAAWPLVFQVSLMARSPAFALPEVVIALMKNRQDGQPLQRFTLSLVVLVTFIMAGFVLTPFSHWYLVNLQDAAPEVAALAQAGMIFLLPLPGMMVLVSWLRGMLIAHQFTRTVNEGMFVNLGITGLILVLAVWQRWTGLIAAAIALDMALLVELIYLFWRVRQKLAFSFPLLKFVKARPTM
ncbi:MAG: hypothetical protein KA314_07290 [Chloroflexi bacterium]|nr:hypothetical protein [Chloroflexota bacterium]MBP8055630.1 hypothetical protein [Chloroflexota bacterium]